MSLLQRLHFGLGRRLPVIFQTEAAECGLACLAMVASYHGFHLDLTTLRHRFQVSLKGSTLAQLIQIGAALQLGSRPLRVDLEELRQLKVPCILHWDLNHFVVLKRVATNSIVVHDPAFGVRKLSYAEVSKHFTGVALELTPAVGFTPQRPTQRLKLRTLFGKVTGFKRSALQILLVALVLEVFALVYPFFLQWVIDHVLISADRDLLTTLGIGFLLLVVLQQGVSALRSWVVMYMSATLNVQWVANVFSHLLRLPVPFFEKRHLGDVVSRFGSIETIQRTLTTSFIEAIIDGVMALVTLAMMLLYSPLLTAVSGAAVALYGLLRWAWYQPLRTATEEQIVHLAKQQGHFLETVRGVRSIKLFNRLDERRSGWTNLVVDQVNATLRTQRLTLAYRVLNGLLFGVERIAVIWMGALLVLDNTFSVGMLLAFVAYKDHFATRMSSLIDKGVEVKMLQLQGERLADIVLSAPEDDAGPAVGGRVQVEPSVQIRDVCFRYADSEPYVLEGCSLDIASGESVAIVGPSGCGKTTLLKIMLGILDPTGGEILIGGVSVRQLGLHTVRKMVGTVMQDDQLFAGSIADNICFFDSGPDHAHLEACAQLAAIHEEIMAMPMGYNTLIGDMGAALSGGQKQRILLARALYIRPQLLFLDEATSHLDVGLEHTVNAAVQRLQLTRVVIAHRPETIKSAERVVVLNAGKIVENRSIAPSSATTQRRGGARSSKKALGRRRR